MAKRANGEGTIKKRSDGRWEAQLVIGGQRKSVYSKTCDGVRIKLNQLSHEIESGLYTEDNGIRTGDWLRRWLYDCKQGCIKPKSFQGYKYILEHHLLNTAFARIKLKALSAEDIRRLIKAKDKEGYSTRTMQYIKSTLHNALNQAIQDGYLARNVAAAVPIPKKKSKPRRILSPEEQQAFEQALLCEPRGFMVFFDMFTGLRCGELIGLRWCDVDMEARTITIRQSIQRSKR